MNPQGRKPAKKSGLNRASCLARSSKVRSGWALRAQPNRYLWFFKGSLALLAGLALQARPAFCAFEDLGAGARAPGMGNAFTAVADDVYAMHYNPAGLSLLSRPELATSYTRLLMGLTDNSEVSNSFIGYAHPLKGGAWGTAATGWQQLSLNSSLYQEHTFYASYGRLAAAGLGPGDLHAGLSAKYLRRALGSFAEAGNAMNGLVATGRPDPVVAGKNGQSATDADLGLLYRFKQNYSLGLAVTHLSQPNVAFDRSDSDPLRRGIKLGVGYRSLLSNIAAQYETARSPAGTQDHILTMAGERMFPKLFVGDFAVRGALGLGSRDHKELDAGLSYRTKRISIDYAFSMPFTVMSSLAGSHRLGFSIRFGRLQEADESVVMILEAMRSLKAGTQPEFRPAGSGLSPAQKAVLEELMAQAKFMQTRARYKAALEKLSQALTMSPADAELLKLFGRLNFVAQAIAELPDYKTDPVHAALHQGVLAYLAHNDLLAVEKTAYALSLAPEHKGLDAFLSQLELATGLKRPELARVPSARFTLEQMATKAASALEDERYDEAVDISQKILKEDPDYLSAWENLGTAFFALGDYRRSLAAWEKAYSLELSPARRPVLKGYLKSIRALLERPAAAARARAAAAQAQAQASPKEIQRLYNQGVDLYMRGDMQGARGAFERVLELDPAYQPAAKALRRIIEDTGQR